MEHKSKGIMALLLDAAVALAGMAITVGGVSMIAGDAKALTKKPTPKTKG